MTIIVNGQSIESDDLNVINGAIRDARKAEVAERKARAKMERTRIENLSQAEITATRVGFAIMCWKAEGNTRSAEFYAANAKDSPVRLTNEYPDTIAGIDVNGGSITFTSFYWDLHGVVANIGGNAMVLFLANKDKPQEIHAYAVGAHNGEYSLLPLPGVVPTDFPVASQD